MRRNARATTARVVAAAMCLGLVAGCGDDGVTAGDWAAEVCGAVKPWSAEVREMQTQAQQRISARSDAEQTKIDLISLFGGMARTTDSAVSKVKSAGVPDVDGGAQISARFVSALTGARDSFDKGRNAVAALPTDDPKTFYNGVVAAGKVMNDENQKAGKAFDDVSSPTLDRAFDEQPACQ